MIDISVKDLVKSFDADTNILDGITFDVQSGERVGLLGKNGAGKTTLFRILTGEIDYNSGEVRFAPGKKVGLISQIPHYPAGYTVDDVLHTAFAGLEKIKKQMRALEAEMAERAGAETLKEYDALANRFQVGGGYEMDTQTDKICNGLAIPAEQRGQIFDSLSGGEKIACRTLLIAAGLVPERGLLAELGMPSWLQMCGNCNTVYPLAEGVTADGRKAGIAAFQKIRGKL